MNLLCCGNASPVVGRPALALGCPFLQPRSHRRCWRAQAPAEAPIALGATMLHQIGRPGMAVCQAVWDESMTLRDLKAQLDAALKVEDYQLAARIRDTIQQKAVDGKLAVEEANERFYAAFRSGSVQEMEQVWGQGEHVQVIHPGSYCIAGREAVMESWRSVLANVRPRAFKVDLEDVRIYAGDGHAYVTCVEVIDADDSKGRICATNIFEKQGDRWFIIMHHGSVAPMRIRRPVTL